MHLAVNIFRKKSSAQYAINIQEKLPTEASMAPLNLLAHLAIAKHCQHAQDAKERENPTLVIVKAELFARSVLKATECVCPAKTLSLPAEVGFVRSAVQKMAL